VLYELALVGTIGVCGWITLDLLVAEAWRHRIASVATLAAAALCWAAGELFVRHAEAASDVVAARRLLFLGVCALGPAWLWSALEARSPGWARRRWWVLGAIALLPLASYSTLYWDRATLFFDWYARPPSHGPLFYVHGAYAWSLVLLGLHVFLRSLADIGVPRSGGDRWLVTVAVLGPLLANVAYVALGVPPFDPTPIALGVSAVAVRSIVLDLTWGAHYLPFARGEVVEQMETGFLVADRLGHVVDCNAAAKTWLEGRAPEGRPLGEVVAEIRARNPLGLEADGFWLKRRGQVVGVGAVIADRTAVRQAEREIEMANRLEALGHLAAGVAHEVNNPLTYVSANLALLEPFVQEAADPARRGVLPAEIHLVAEDAETMISESREGVERIRLIVEQLGTFAERRGDESARRTLDLARPTERAVAMAGFGREKTVVRLKRSERVPTIYAVESEIVDIVFHLLLNAFQASEENAVIDVELGSRENGAVVSVSDRGPGIPAAHLPHIFDPFFTTGRPGRLGLGLSRSWEMARRNGGWIEAGNRPEGGAVFTLWLPAKERTPRGSHPRQARRASRDWDRNDRSLGALGSSGVFVRAFE
jgi:signal transduction histidine kinase